MARGNHKALQIARLPIHYLHGIFKSAIVNNFLLRDTHSNTKDCSDCEFVPAAGSWESSI